MADESNALVLATTEQAVTSITPESERDSILTTYDRILFFAREIDRLKKLCELQMLEWIKANGDMEVANGVRYIAGVDKVTKCINMRDAVEAIIDAAGGDMGKICDVLSSNALKYGAAKQLLSPDKFGKFFVTEIRETLEEKAAPKKKLVRLDEKFIKRN